VLKTLDKYIAPPVSERDRRFARILAVSVICHIIFWAVVIRADIWSKWEEERRGTGQPELVVVTEIAPPAEKPLRAPVEKIDRVDKDRLKFDPRRADDMNLVARSPKLGSPEGKHTGSAKSQAVKSSAPSAAPSDSARKLVAVTPPLPVVTAQTPAQNTPAPAASIPAQNAAAPPAPPAQPGESSEREERQGTRELSTQTIESQYLAYVRARIRQANERVMPSDWIRDVLTRQVSADFEIMIARGGQLLSARLLKSSGYPTLDDAARQAIYIAKPFEGYPPGAGDTLTLRVTVYYAPSR
jgi:TonB family protein